VQLAPKEITDGRETIPSALRTVSGVQTFHSPFMSGCGSGFQLFSTFINRICG
jgi:hypothetical protein